MVKKCDPTYGRVDELLSLLTKSKSLHTLMILDRKKNPARFSELKKLVDSSSTTVARRLNELETHGLVSRTQTPNSEHGFEIRSFRRVTVLLQDKLYPSRVS